MATSKKVRPPSRQSRTSSHKPKSAPANNGLRRFAMHVGDSATSKRFKSLRATRARHPGFAGVAATAGADLTRLDAETVARHHLEQALAEKAVPELTAPAADGEASEFKSIGSEYVPLTKTRTVKFRQQFHKIPVYGSLVTVELDERNECLAISSSLAEPGSVDPVAKVAPSVVQAKAKQLAGSASVRLSSVPRLHYYYDAGPRRWRLVYIIENVPVRTGPKTNKRGAHVAAKDFVFDAHTGQLVAELPRTGYIAAKTASARDGLGRKRRFGCAAVNETRILHSTTLNVHTHDFAFGDPDKRHDLLPGEYVANPPKPWAPAGVSAHANAEDVARFLRDALKRNSIDNRGGAMRSSINCVVEAESNDGEEWMNAYWNGSQMVYGQRKDKDALHTLAENPDVVGHEMFHGVTDYTARLEYAKETGALNESYSDIFGLVISNWAESDISKWNWEIGEGLDRGGAPFRDMRDPERCRQPKHMKDFEELPDTYEGDWGGVHINSGIHNYAAYRILSARAGTPKRYVLTPAEVAAMFYICLTQYLSRTSTFADSRSGVLLAARTLFRKDAASVQEQKIKAIEKGFKAAGIAG